MKKKTDDNSFNKGYELEIAINQKIYTSGEGNSRVHFEKMLKRITKKEASN